VPTWKKNLSGKTITDKTKGRKKGTFKIKDTSKNADLSYTL